MSLFYDLRVLIYYKPMFLLSIAQVKFQQRYLPSSLPYDLILKPPIIVFLDVI